METEAWLSSLKLRVLHIRKRNKIKSTVHSVSSSTARGNGDDDTNDDTNDSSSTKGSTNNSLGRQEGVSASESLDGTIISRVHSGVSWVDTSEGSSFLITEGKLTLTNSGIGVALELGHNAPDSGFACVGGANGIVRAVDVNILANASYARILGAEISIIAVHVLRHANTINARRNLARIGVRAALSKRATGTGIAAGNTTQSGRSIAGGGGDLAGVGVGVAGFGGAGIRATGANDGGVDTLLFLTGGWSEK